MYDSGHWYSPIRCTQDKTPAPVNHLESAGKRTYSALAIKQAIILVRLNQIAMRHSGFRS